MDPETLFTICQDLVLPGWLLLIAAPRWKWTTRLITSVLLPAVLGIIYAALIATNIGSAEGNFNSLAGVASLFRNPYLLLAGWVHYLAFDLFVGSWQVRDAARLGIRHWFVIPCLILTLMLGPTGLLLYLVLRYTATRQIAISPDST